MATTRNSTLYANLFVNLYLGDSRNIRGRVQPFPFSHTVISGETGGASAGVQDKVNLTVIPKAYEVIDLIFKSNALWGSAGTNGTLQIGDALDDDRYMTATELYSAESPLPSEGTVRTGLAFAGQNYVTTVDTIVVATYKVANPVVGKIFKGVILAIPGT